MVGPDGLKNCIIPISKCFISSSPLIIDKSVTRVSHDEAGPDKRYIRVPVLLFLHDSICCGYSLDASRRDASNEYPQQMLLGRNNRNFFIFQF